MKPKVIHLLDDSRIGGITNTLGNLVTSHLAEEFEFIVSAIDARKPIFYGLKADIIIIHYSCNWRKLPNLILLKLLNPEAHLIVHEHHYSQGFQQCNVPNPSRFHLMLKLSYSLANQVVAISQAQSKWLQQNCLVSPEKLILIPQCRILKDFLAVTPKLAEPPLVLGAYGRFHAQKGFDVLLKAMKLVSPSAVKLRIGGYGSQESELKQLAQELDNVEFVGQVNDVPAFLQQCDAVAIPSRWEPWGNVCLEAKAAAKPVIASDIDGLSEQINNCGLLVPPENPQALADAIQSLASLSSQELEMLGKQGRDSGKDAWETYLDRWEKLLLSVI
jgi:glycosyltransferase involved in cell wall biosynthesis